MAGWADILGGALSGMGGQLGQIQQQRDQEVQRQLQERQVQEQTRKNDLDLFLQKVEAIPLDADVDEETLKQGATLGLAGIFQKDPTSGGIRRVKSISDKAAELNLQTAEVTNQKVKYEFDRFIEAKDPNLFAKLQTQFPDPNVRRFVAEQVYGIKADPVTLPEEQEQRRFEAQNAASVYAAMIRNQGTIGAAQVRAGGTSGAEAMTPNIIRDLARVHGEAEANPTDLSLDFSRLRNLQNPVVSKPSAAARARDLTVGNVLTRFPPQAVTDAETLVKAMPEASMADLMAAAARIPGFDPAADGPVLQQVLRVMGKQ